MGNDRKEAEYYYTVQIPHDLECYQCVLMVSGGQRKGDINEEESEEKE